MHILVIGGSGTISTAVVAELRHQGHRVTLCNRGRRPPPPGCDHLRCDRADPEAFAAAVDGHRFDAAIDFVCFDPADAAGAHRALAGRCDQYVFISSATVYRKPHRLPVHEDDPCGNPVSPYAERKRRTEDWLLARGESLPVTVVRPSHTICDGYLPSPMHGGDFTIAARIRAGRPILVHDSGRSLWAVTAAEDLAVGLVGLLGQTDCLGQCYHITTDQVTTWRGIYHEIGRALGVEPVLVPIPTAFLCTRAPRAAAGLAGDKAHDAVFDNTRCKRAVPAFACRWSLRDQITRSIDGLLADPARQVVDPDKDREIDALIAAWRETTATEP